MSHYTNHIQGAGDVDYWHQRDMMDSTGTTKDIRPKRIPEPPVRHREENEGHDDRPEVLFVEAPARILEAAGEGVVDAVEIVVYDKDGNIVGAMTRKAAETFFGEQCVGGRFKVRAIDVDSECVKRLVGLERINGNPEKPKEESTAERMIRNRTRRLF